MLKLQNFTSCKCLFFLNQPMLTLNTQVDPMFQRLASSFDETSTAGVFLSVLFSENSSCELLFPSHMTLLQSRPSYCPPTPQKVPASPFKGKNQVQKLV